MAESEGSEASDKPRSIRSQGSDASSLETKSEPIRKISLERKGDRKEQERESSPESATSLLRKRCNRDNLEILPSKRDLSTKSDVKGEEVKEKDTNYIPASPSRLRKVTSPHVDSVKLGEKPQSDSGETNPKSPRRLVNVNHSSSSSSPVHIARKWESGSNKGSSESLGSRDGKSLVQERKEIFAVRGLLEKSASLDSSQITGQRAKSDVGRDKKESTDVASSQRRAVSQWVDKHDAVLSKSMRKPEDKSVNNLRKKFTTLEYGGGSAPNVSEVGHQSLKDKYTPRSRREAPKQGCVRQLSQAFSMISLMEDGQQRRGSTSSSVKSSPRSLSPASSTNSLIASQIKKLQDKATPGGASGGATGGSTSDVSSSRRQSVETSKTSTRENSPVPGSPLIGRRDYRQSLPNIAAVRAKFDKSGDKPAAATDSGTDSKDDSKSNNKPARTKSTPTNRISYKVSVVNDDDKEKSSPTATAKDAKSAAEVSVRVRSPRLVAVIESPPEKEEDGTVTFTLKPNPTRSRVSKVNSAPQQTKGTSSNNNTGNVRRKTQMFTATVEETTTVVKKPKADEKKEEKKVDKKEVKIEVKSVATNARQTTSAVRPKETSTVRTGTVRTSAVKSVEDRSNEREESARNRRRRREQSSNSLSPAPEHNKSSDKTTGSVTSAGKSPDRRGRRSRNRRDLKSPSQDLDNKKAENDKQEKSSVRGARRERERKETNTKTEMTETQRKEAILARRERREAREAREAARVERKDSKKEKSTESVERKDSKNTKGDSKVERKDSTKSRNVKVDRKDSKTKKDVRLQRTESDLRNEKKDTDSPLRSLRRRRSKKDELGTPSVELDSTSEGASASGNSELDSTSQSSDYPDLLANTRRKNRDGSAKGENRSSRCARAVVAHSALKGAEALIGTQLPKTVDEDPDERKSRKDKSRRGRAINRADRISRLDLFRRARSVDSSKATKDRSPSHERGKTDRAQSVDRTSKKRESSIDRQKGDGKNWLSKRTGSITNFLRASK